MKALSSRQFVLLMLLGVTGIAGWTVLYFYYGVGRLHHIALAGALVTAAMMGTLVFTRVSRKPPAELLLVLMMAALLLGIAAMVFAVL